MANLPAANAITALANNAAAQALFETLRDWLSQLPAAPEVQLTIAGGTITPATRDQGSVKVETEAAAATDDLANIAQTNIQDGQLLLVRASVAGHTVVVKHAAGGAGQIKLKHNADWSLNATDKWLLVKRIGTDWQEILRSYGNDPAAERAAIAAVNTVIAAITGSLALSGVVSPSQYTSDQNDLSPTGWSAGLAVIRFTTDASRNFTGLAEGAAGKLAVFFNVGSNNGVLKNESASSTAANRFALDADATIPPGRAALLWYDTTSSRWRPLALPASTAASALLPTKQVFDTQLAAAYYDGATNAPGGFWNNSGVFSSVTETGSFTGWKFTNAANGYVVPAGLAFNLLAWLATKNPIFAVNMCDDSVAGTRYWGFFASLAPANGIYFRHTLSGNLIAVCRAAGVETAYDTGIAASTSVTRELKIVVTAGGTSVEFFVDGASVQTMTTNIPSAAMMAGHGSSAATVVRIGHMHIEQEL